MNRHNETFRSMVPTAGLPTQCYYAARNYRSDSAPYNSCVSCQAEAVETCLENAPEWIKESMAVGVGCRTEAVETCILENSPEWIRSNMAAASVLLGLLPTILSLAGSSTVKLVY